MEFPPCGHQICHDHIAVQIYVKDFSMKCSLVYLLIVCLYLSCKRHGKCLVNYVMNACLFILYNEIFDHVPCRSRLLL